LLDRLVGVARQTGIHLTELRQLGCHGALHNSVPRIIALHKDVADD
jgi:hypothetical protein